MIQFQFEPCPNCGELMSWDNTAFLWFCTATECPVYELSEEELAALKRKLGNQSDAQS